MTLQPTPVSAAVQTLAPWQSYICHACGYIYNEAEGDPDSGLAAGTRFCDIPEDWAGNFTSHGTPGASVRVLTCPLAAS